MPDLSLLVRPNDSLTETVGRRTFLKVLGSAGPAAAITACSPVTPEQIIPYVVPPEDVIPGVATWYATVCRECPAGCGMVVRTREGRAVKVEGNPEHPVNRGKLCIRGQASLQGLYNPDRLSGPRRRRPTNDAAGQSVLEPVTWEVAQEELAERIRALRAAGQANRIAIVTPLTTGTLDTLVDRWADAVGGARRLRYEPFAYESLRAANRLAFARDEVPWHDFATPELVVSFGADFLETWLSTVGHARDHAVSRRLKDGRRTRFVQIEPRQSLTGSSADERLDIAPDTEVLVAAAMVETIVSEQRAQGVSEADLDRIARLVQEYAPDQVTERVGLNADTIRELARSFSDPSAGPGRTLAVGGGVAASGANAMVAQVAINLLNYVAGNIGTTIRFTPDTNWDRANSYRDMVELTDAMRSGEIDVLVLHDVNPVHTMPGGLDVAGALAKVPLVVSTSSFPDETSAQAHLLLPTHTPLESWGDYRSRTGTIGLLQPTMPPLFDTKHLGDLLIDIGRALGDDMAEALPRDFYQFLRSEWTSLILPLAEGGNESEPDFETFWAAAVKRGGFWHEVEPEYVALNPALFDRALNVATDDSNRNFTLLVYPSLHYYDGRGANRPWLQEIPDPLLKTTWGSWAEVSPDTARSIGAENGQLITVESDHGRLDVSVLITPQLHPGVVALPLGQGHTDYGRYATGRGVNPMLLLDPNPDEPSGGIRWLGTRVDMTARALHRPVPQLQTEFDQQNREVAQTVSLATLAAGEIAPEAPHASLYPEHEHPVHRWGMAIDLDACNGCNACVAACYAENNIPVMGADRMRRGRTMSWLRIERFDADENGPHDTRFVPMLCQHCDHAPCESVCPVYATYHTEEGLNAQVYNRCVGTRYCANNCPYKVRRFNWFLPEFPEPLNLQLNPDVTARSSGVMEKCTFCVQRIQAGKDHAKDKNRPVRDGEVAPACAQTCPAEAIVFGDLNDLNSRVSRLSAEARTYHIFGALNTRPAVTYLKKVTPE